MLTRDGEVYTFETPLSDGVIMKHYFNYAQYRKYREAIGQDTSRPELITRIRMSFDDKPTLRLILKPHEKDEKEIDTEVNQNFSEAYLDAEVFITKYLIENKFITLEE